MKTILAALNAKFVHSNLAIRYIKAYCREYDIELFETSINDNFMESAFSIIDRKPDIVAFSCYIWNIEGTLKVCSIIKEILPDIIIVLGGPEVSYNGREYLEVYDYVDYIIQGEGEVAFKSLLAALTSGDGRPQNIEGLVFKDENKVAHGSGFALIKNLDAIPFPYENEIPNKIVYYEASRGCPFSCSYCLSGSAKGVRYFDINRVKKDLHVLIDNGVELVKFVDRTFNANKRFAIEIWEYLATYRGETRFHFEISADLLDDDIIKFLEKVPRGLFQFEIGVQSTNSEVLKNIGRVMDFNKIKENMSKIMKGSNIHSHMDLIAGLPGENLASFIKSFEDCMSMSPEVLQLGFLKVLKGSRVYQEREKYGIHYVNHPNYQVLYTSDMSYDDMRMLQRLERVFEIYYNSGIYRITMEFLLQFEETKFKFFEDFMRFLEKRNFFERNLDLRDRFKLLYDYAILFHDEDIVKDILIHDFIINTKKSVLPDFLKKDICSNLKDILNENKNRLKDYFENYDPKKIFALQTNFKLIKHYNSHRIFKEKSIVVFNLVNGEYCYLV